MKFTHPSTLRYIFGAAALAHARTELNLTLLYNKNEQASHCHVGDLGLAQSPGFSLPELGMLLRQFSYPQGWGNGGVHFALTDL